MSRHDEQTRLARECWARDMTVDEAYDRIRHTTSAIMPLHDVMDVYAEQNAAFEQWCTMHDRAAKAGLL
jgi:hypothetical protein